MKNLTRFSSFVWILVLATAGPAWGQEFEPNNSCPDAANLTGIALPISIEGSLDSTATNPDVDFFRFTTPAGTQVRVQLGPDPNAETPLVEPLLGVWDSYCNLWTSSLGYPDLTLDMNMPEGEFVLSVSHSGDWSFEGGGSGAYLLSVSVVPIIGSISGRLVNTVTDEPVTGDIRIEYCPDPSGCHWVNWVASDPETGFFRFSTNFWGEPLVAGSYRFSVNAFPFEPSEFGPFEVGQDEHLDVGDLELLPLRLIGSVSGRLVDALSGAPIPFDFFYPTLQLIKCGPTPWGESCTWQASANPDEQGRFVLANPYITVGRFYIFAWADQYQGTQTGFFEVGEGEHFDVGDVELQPLPIQFLRLQPCEDIPARGGTCRFTVEIRNGSNNRVRGGVWALVGVYDTGSPGNFSQFQIGKHGAKNPQARPFNLGGGQGLPIDFSLEIPGTVSPGASVCVDAWAGQDPRPEINTLGVRNLFCVSKSSQRFETVTGAKAHDIKRQKERERNP